MVLVTACLYEHNDCYASLRCSVDMRRSRKHSNVAAARRDDSMIFNYFTFHMTYKHFF